MLISRVEIMEIVKYSLIFTLFLSMLHEGSTRPQGGKMLSWHSDDKFMSRPVRSWLGSVQVEEEDHRHIFCLWGTPTGAPAPERDLPEEVRVQQQEPRPQAHPQRRRLQDSSDWVRRLYQVHGKPELPPGTLRHHRRDANEEERNEKWYSLLVICPLNDLLKQS